MDKKEGNGQHKNTSIALDLSDFVTEVDRFSRLIEPFALVFYTVDDIRRWQFRNGTIIVWLLCNAACIFLTQGAVFVLVSSLVIAIATLSLFQVHTRILNKILPNNKKPTKLNDGDEDGGVLDTVQNFRYSLIEMHDFVVKSNEYLSYFYSILKWDAVGPSAIYYTETCIFLLSLVMLPARWNCFLLINWFFLCHPHIIQKGWRFVKENWKSVKESPKQKEEISCDKSEKDEDHCDGNIEEDNDDDDDSDVDMTDTVADDSLIRLDPSPTKPGMVARKMDIKKRKKQLGSESCQGCKVSFASILKKRLYCRHCGYSFCNRCCFQKVPRSVFGATSPAALKETVLVCCSCHALLVNQSDTPSDKQGPG